MTGKAPSNKGAALKAAVVPVPPVRQAVAVVAAPSTNSSDFPSLSATAVSATKITEAKSKKQHNSNSKGIEPDSIVSFIVYCVITGVTSHRKLKSGISCYLSLERLSTQFIVDYSMVSTGGSKFRII